MTSETELLASNEDSGRERQGFVVIPGRSIEGAYAMRKKAPTAWPNTVKYNYAGAEQAVGLTQMMLDHGYPEEVITDILGENWARIARAVWK